MLLSTSFQKQRFAIAVAIMSDKAIIITKVYQVVYDPDGSFIADIHLNLLYVLPDLIRERTLDTTCLRAGQSQESRSSCSVETGGSLLQQIIVDFVTCNLNYIMYKLIP